MSSSTSPIELINPGRWTVGFARPGPVRHCFEPSEGLNKSWKQHPIKQQLYSDLPPITKTIKIRHAGHCWRSRDELISDSLLWTPSHGRTKAGRPALTYILQMLIRDVALKTYRKQWTIWRGGESDSGISVLIAQYGDDDYNESLNTCSLQRAHIFAIENNIN